MGGRFQLKASKSEYLVSNNPELLEQDDILLSPGTSGEVLLKILCDYDKRVGTLEVIEADRPIMVGETPVRGTAPLKDGDTIRIDIGQLLRCNFSERIIEEERNIIRTLEVRDVTHRFSNSEVALDGISFTVNRGEMVCVMGASGSGKSTLLKVLGGQLQPTQRRGAAQRPVALREPRRCSSATSVTSRRRTLSTSTSPSGRTSVRGGHPLAASFAARSHPADGGQS